MNAYPEFDDEDFDEDQDQDTSRVTYQARKAAMEDLDFLRGLWRAQGVDPADFEERWPEFHVIIDLQGEPVGAVGFMVEGKNGWLFFEGYDLETAAESAQELAINRVVNLAKSQGLLRVWSHLDSANLESRNFTVATPSQRTFLPVEWDRALAPEPNQRVDWKVVQIRDEAAMQQMEKELALFDAMNQGRRMSDQKPVAGKMMSILAIILAIVIFGIGIYVLFFYANQATTPRS